MPDASKQRRGPRHSGPDIFRMQMVVIAASALCIAVGFNYLAGAFALAYAMHRLAIAMNAALPSRRRSLILAWLIIISIGIGTAAVIQALIVLASAFG